MQHPDALYQIAATLIPGVGPITLRKLIAHLGSSQLIFRQSPEKLQKIPGVGEYISSQIAKTDALNRAEQELRFIEKHKIKLLHFTSPEYPHKLRQCDDAPTLLYYRGTELNFSHTVSIVGTRAATHYGQQFCKDFVAELSQQSFNPLIISGLAYGIDIAAHRAALHNGLDTLGVMAHGFGTLYPPEHKQTATEILSQGGLITEFPSYIKPFRNNFLSRNRIIAGLSDAIVVVESDIKGGAMVTATLGLDYNREVFAVPGRLGDTYSQGCHKLIATNRAQIYTNFSDFLSAMNWNSSRNKPIQQRIVWELSPEQQTLVDILLEQGECSADMLCTTAKFPVSKVLTLLLELEFAGHVRSLAGKKFVLTHN